MRRLGHFIVVQKQGGAAGSPFFFVFTSKCTCQNTYSASRRHETTSCRQSSLAPYQKTQLANLMRKHITNITRKLPGYAGYFFVAAVLVSLCKWAYQDHTATLAIAAGYTVILALGFVGTALFKELKLEGPKSNLAAKTLAASGLVALCGLISTGAAFVTQPDRTSPRIAEMRLQQLRWLQNDVRTLAYIIEERPNAIESKLYFKNGVLHAHATYRSGNAKQFAGINVPDMTTIERSVIIPAEDIPLAEKMLQRISPTSTTALTTAKAQQVASLE